MKLYEELKKKCGEVGCYCPSEGELNVVVSNVPKWQRLYFTMLHSEEEWEQDSNSVKQGDV